MKYTIDNVNCNMLVNGVHTKQYSDAEFRRDYNSKNGGIKVKFGGALESAHFNWRTIDINPSSFMFFGTPLSHNRSFNSIFRTADTLSLIHHPFVC